MGNELDKLYYTLGIQPDPGNKAVLSGVEAEVDAAGTRIKAKTASFFSETQAGSANLLRMKQSIKDTFGEADKAITSAHGSAAVATREFRALFDELSSGRTRMTPGTLAIIATRVFGISGATLAWGAALAAIPIAFAVAAVSAENAMDRAERAILRTGFAAGVTNDQLEQMAKNLDATGRISERGGLDVLGTLAGRGNVGRGNLQNAGLATSDYARASGESLDKAAEQFEKILAEPSKGAQQLNADFKLLSVAQTRQIDALEKSGQVEAAQRIIIDATISRFGGLKDSAWSLSKMFDGVGHALSDFWFNTGKAAAGISSTQALEARLATLMNSGLAKSNPTEFKTLTDQINKQLADSISQGVAARAGAARNSSDRAIGAGMADVDKTDLFTAHMRALHEELDRDQLAVRKATETHSQFTDALIKQRDAVATAIKNQKTPAQLAAEEAQDARTVAATPASRRGQVQAEIAARRERERNLANPDTAQYADSIYGSKMDAANYNLADQRRQEAAARRAANAGKRQGTGNDVAEIEAKDQEKLVAAYRVSIQAGEAMNAQIDAEVAKRRGEISDTNAYVQAKTREANAKRSIAAIKEDAGMDRENASLKTQISLLGENETVRERKLAELQLENDLVQKGWDLSTAAGQAELALEKQKLDLKLAYNKTLKDAATSQENDLSLMQQGIGMFSNVLSSLNSGAQGMKNILPSLERDIASLIEKLAILNPLENMMTGSITGTPGTAPTIGGPLIKAVGSYIGNLFAMGGAWNGGVRFAAQGMVLGGPTMFAAAGGPVIGGEAGPEALMPLARGPGGLGVRVHGGGGNAPVHVHQQINIHPDVSAVARAEIFKQLPEIQKAAISGVKAAQTRGVPLRPGSR